MGRGPLTRCNSLSMNDLQTRETYKKTHNNVCLDAICLFAYYNYNLQPSLQSE